jgi:competence protein ComEC
MKSAHIFLLISIVSIVALRWHFLPTDSPQIAQFLLSLPSSTSSVQMIGNIIDEPEKKKTHINVLIEVEQYGLASSTDMDNTVQVQYKKNVLVLASIPQFSSVNYGDKIKVVGKIKKPEVIISEDGSEFNYPAYLAKSNIFYVMDAKSSEIISTGGGNPIKSDLLLFKKQLLQNINNVLPTPHSFLAGGLIIAGKGSLDDELQEEFKRAGLVHIVVLSGFNITIVGQFIISIFSFLPLMLKSIFGSLGIIAFSVMAGSSATVVRSVVMSIIGLYARVSEKSYDALRGLLVAGVGMVVHNPRILLYDPSFQLSFMATLGLILLGSTVQKFFMWVPETLGMREIVTSTFATQIFVTPLILHLSGMISLVSLFVNILVLPVIPLTMLFACLCGVVSFIHPSFSIPFSFVSYILLTYELSLVHIFSSLSFAAISLPKISTGATLAVYSIYGVIFICIQFVQKIYKTKSPPT